jgi:hypothetical protein
MEFSYLELNSCIVYSCLVDNIFGGKFKLGWTEKGLTKVGNNDILLEQYVGK